VKEIIVPDSVYEIAYKNLGLGFTDTRPGNPLETVEDFLSQKKFIVQVKTLMNYIDPSKLSYLEIGSGYGINLALMIHNFGVDGFGVEPPDSQDFPGGVKASQIVLNANGYDSRRVFAGYGEAIPFPSDSFDLVYSCNVLEHVSDPKRFFKRLFVL
jgi:SAM-dependent methyltransferase